VSPEDFKVHAGREALLVLAANPALYVSRWWETWVAFSGREPGPPRAPKPARRASSLLLGAPSGRMLELGFRYC